MEINEIIELKNHLRDDTFGALRGQIDTLTNYYEQRMSLGKMPKDIEVYRSPKLRAQVDTAVDHIMALGERVTVPYWSEAEEEKNKAAKFERFGIATLQWINQHFRTKRNCIKHGILYGMFARKGPIYLPRLAPTKTKGEKPSDYQEKIKDFEKELEITFPFHFKSAHPRNIYFDISDPPQYIIEFFSRTAISFKETWPEWNMGDSKPYDIVEGWEFWSPKQRAFFIADENILNVPNVYGFIPYSLGFAGFGTESSEGKIEDLVVSMIAPALSAYKMESRMKTAISAGLEYGVYGRPTTSLPPGDDFKLANAPGEISTIPDVYKFRNEVPPQVTPDAYRWLGLIDNDEQTVMPNALQGTFAQGVTSGYMGAIGVGQARLRLDALKGEWENTSAAMLDRLLLLIKNVVRESVGLFAVLPEGKSMQTIRPTEINPRLHHFSVKLDAESPEDRDRRIMLGVRLFMSKALSWETICKEYFNIEPTRERQRMLIEYALASPLIQQAIAYGAVQDAGMHEVLELLKDGKLEQIRPQGGEQPRQTDYTRNQMRLEPGTDELGSQAEMRGAPQQPGMP